MILIKQTSQEDLPFLRRLWNCGEVMRWVGFSEGLNQSQADIDAWYERLQNKHNEHHFSIYDGNTYCGETFYRYQEHNTTVDIKLLPQAQGKGIASYALSYCMSQVFMKYPSTIISVDPHPKNDSAIKLYDKLGFIKATDIVYECSYHHFKVDKRVLRDHIKLRPYTQSDEHDIWLLTSARNDYEWMDWDGPYFEKQKPQTFSEYLVSPWRKRLLDKPNTIQLITLHDHLLGFVSSYFENETTRWLEMGSILFESHHWSKGYGRVACQKWIDFLFETHPLIERVGLTTWSGNQRMIQSAYHLNMRTEAIIRKVRFHKGVYYDIVKLGITRDEWNLSKKWKVSEVISSDDKSRITKSILRKLPEWFGIEEATQHYIDTVKDSIFFTVNHHGFIALIPTSEHVLDIYVMGIDPTHHRDGIGSALIFKAATYGRTHGYQYLSVKTLDKSHPSEAYKKTRRFYKRVGFVEVEVFPELWDSSNPCLLMMMKL